MAEIPDLIVIKSGPFYWGKTPVSAPLSRVDGVSRSESFVACGGIEMWSMWNAPSDRDYYNWWSADCDEDEPDICGGCGARWDLGETCEEWCATNRAEPEPVPITRLGVEEQEVTFFEGALNK
jgi:hypothetical protein